MIDKIGHYSLTHPASVYDEEALTALELAGRTAAKTNECVDVVNTMEKGLPDKVDKTVQNYIKDGTFDKAIDAYADRLGEEMDSFETNVNTRIDNILGAVKPGSTSMDAEIVDARLDGFNEVHPSLGASIRKQTKDSVNSYTGFLYMGNGDPISISTLENGALSVYFPGRLTKYTDKGNGYVDWEAALTHIADKFVFNSTTHKTGTLTLPCYKSFVYNTREQAYFIRNGGTCDTYDILLIQNAYANPTRGCLMDELQSRQINASKTEMYQVRGAYLYLGSNSDIIFTPDTTTGTLDAYFIGRPTFCWGANNKTLEWDSSNLSEIAQYVSIESKTRATIHIPAWYALVYNHLDNKYYLRWRAGLREGDVLALATGYAQPLCGPLLEEWTAKRADNFQDYVNAQGMLTDTPPALTTFANLFNGVDTCESFMFFTDPHVCEGHDWQNGFQKYKTQMQALYDLSPVSFTICGGDWLGNGDTMGEAAQKLGLIDAQMRRTFDRYYPVVGNHDTNYQGKADANAENGTGQLANETIRNLWMRGKENCYYSFDGNNTRFFVFDSGIDWVNTFDEYRQEQIAWVAGQLKNNTFDNVAFVTHIFFNESADTDGMTPFAAAMTLLGKTFNERGTYTLNGVEYNFAGCKGKVRFILSGHRHGDTLTSIDTIPIVVTTHTRAGDQATFDLCLADYDNNVLHLVRVGHGEKEVRTTNI